MKKLISKVSNSDIYVVLWSVLILIIIAMTWKSALMVISIPVIFVAAYFFISMSWEVIKFVLGAILLIILFTALLI